MENTFNFDEIRPFYDSELQSAFEKLTTDVEFMGLIQKLFPQIPLDKLELQLKNTNSKNNFQQQFISPLLRQLEQKTSKGITFSGLESLEKNTAYLFISNHRDIILDSAFLNYILLNNGFNTTEIAIGDNLLIKDWIRTLVRINKSFIIQRNAPIRQMVQILARQSAYIHHTICERNQSIWIAQREGRAKDSNDRTQESLLKMFVLGQNDNFANSIKKLHICPLTISYEYDACDFLKAKEFQQKRDNENFKKTPMDDFINMKQGLEGYKGHIHFHFGGEINNELELLNGNKNEQVTETANIIDKKIHSNYRIYKNNMIAYDLLLHTQKYKTNYTDEEKVAFEDYLQQQIALIDLENKDMEFLKQKMLEIYANILINKEKA